MEDVTIEVRPMVEGRSRKSAAEVFAELAPWGGKTTGLVPCHQSIEG
jgi:hypothetical protein